MESSQKWMLALLIGSGLMLWRGRGASAMPAEAIPVLGGGDVSLARCATERCLTIMVAPWCPACRQAGGMIKDLRDHLDKRGIHTRIVVTLDQPAAIQEYAASYGPGTVVDYAGVLHPRGVPHCYLSDARGKVLHETAGFPITNDPALAARYLGL